MAILKNKTQGNFTMIDNKIFYDRKLSMKDRGVLCTICSLPDGWKFSVKGLRKIVPDGKETINTAIIRLEERGYIKRIKSRGYDGRFISVIEVSIDDVIVPNFPPRAKQPSERLEDELSPAEKVEYYRALIAKNIELDLLLDAAEKKGGDEVKVVNEIYSLICDTVCFPSEKAKVIGAEHTGENVKTKFLELRYDHIARILNRIVDANLKIRNMNSYLLKTLYNECLTGTLAEQAEWHDDLLKEQRGKPYPVKEGDK